MGIMARIKGEEPGIIKKVPHALKGKGHYGEYLTEYALEHGGLGETAVYRNLIVPRRNGPTSTSEIDVLMLHEKGVFVFESKNYSGWIFGTEGQREWTVTFSAGSKERFYNPIRQNRAHVRALAAFLELPPEAFRSYIVFSERCELKDVPADTDEYLICRRHNLLKRLRKDLKTRASLLDAEALLSAKSKLDSLAGESTAEARATHIEEAKRVASGNACPRCGAELVTRDGKNGTFIGCSAFPKCRYTRPV